MSGSLSERLNKIMPRITSDEFLSGSGIGNETAFYIFDYPPEDELRVRDFLRTLLGHVPKQKHGMRVKHIDLFDFMIDHLRSRGLLDKAINVPGLLGRALGRHDKLAGIISEMPVSAEPSLPAETRHEPADLDRKPQQALGGPSPGSGEGAATSSERATEEDECRRPRSHGGALPR
jgi:hypothetical protein